jgi:hypothetical protein
MSNAIPNPPKIQPDQAIKVWIFAQNTDGSLSPSSGGGGGGGGNVNITGINGNTPGVGFPLFVELSDGTNPIGVPSNPLSVQTSPADDSSIPLQQTVGASAISILVANLTRLEAMVVNTGTTVIYLGLGRTPTIVNYHVALAACSVANDGTGGTYITDIWKGAINAISNGAGGTVCVTELTA